MENVFLTLCREDQNRAQQSPKNSIDKNDPIDNQATPEIPHTPVIDLTTGETPHSQIRKKELVKNRECKENA